MSTSINSTHVLAKEEQLGMKVGTAQHRLRTNIMFELAWKCDMLSCFRCGKKIEKVEDMSIEHKEPWVGVSVALFWDITNIAFSHKKCNFGAIRSPKLKPWVAAALRKQGEPGTAWCGRCRLFLKRVEFGNQKTRWTGLQSECKKCRSRVRRKK